MPGSGKMLAEASNFRLIMDEDCSRLPCRVSENFDTVDKADELQEGLRALRGASTVVAADEGRGRSWAG